jgi:hypothetical protein
MQAAGAAGTATAAAAAAAPTRVCLRQLLLDLRDARLDLILVGLVGDEGGGGVGDGQLARHAQLLKAGGLNLRGEVGGGVGQVGG